MVVRKPIEKEKKTEADFEKMIAKGALVHEDIKPKEDKKNAHINFRIPSDMLNNVDEALKERVGMSRNAWILEAIHEKLKKVEQR